MEFDVNDYLDEDQKQEIAEQMFRDSLRGRLNNPQEIERILTNISYYAVFQEVDAAIEGGGETLRNRIRDRAYEHLNESGKYEIFRSKTTWQDASLATKIVEEFIQEKKDLIEERVHQAITQMPFDKVKEEITYVLHDRIDNILAGIEEE